MERYAETYWTEADIAEALESYGGIKATDERIQSILGAINWEHLQEKMIEAGWDVIYQTISDGQRFGYLPETEED